MILYAQMPSADQLRQNLAHAPAEWRAAVDANRLRRGMEALWPAPAKAKQVRTAKPTKAKRGPLVVISRGQRIELPPLPQHCGRVVALVAPGTSNPCRCQGDDQLLPETIAPGAWKNYLRAIKDGAASCELQIEHNRSVVASTAKGTLVLSADIVSGLMIEATFGVGGFEAMHHRTIRERPQSVGVSCDLIPVAFHHEQRHGRLVRVVTEARLQSHVALLMPSGGQTPAYSLSRVSAVADDKPETAQRELRRLVMSVAGR